MIVSSQCGVMEKGCISGSSVWGAAFIGKFLSFKQTVKVAKWVTKSLAFANRVRRY